MKSYHCLSSEQETAVLRVPSVERGGGERGGVTIAQASTTYRCKREGGSSFKNQSLDVDPVSWRLHQLPKIMVKLASL